jgi:hypothetical protein
MEIQINMTKEAAPEKEKQVSAEVGVPLWSQDPAVNAVTLVLLSCYQT